MGMLWCNEMHLALRDEAVALVGQKRRALLIDASEKKQF